MAKTRTAKPVAKDNTKDTSEITNTKTPNRQLGPESANPPKVFILPKDTSSEARIVTLQNPRYETDSRYLICPERGIYEFTRIAAPKSVPKSWLLSTQDVDAEKEGVAAVTKVERTTKSTGSHNQDDISKGYVLKQAEMLIATPLDPLFLVLPALCPPTPIKSNNTTEPPKQLFLSGEDYLDRITKVSPHLKTMLHSSSVRTIFESRMAVVCDTVSAGDEVMYRINQSKLLSVLFTKAESLVQRGLPESMEDKFIRKALDVPMLCVQRDEGSYHAELRRAEEEEKEGSQTSTPTTNDSQSSVGSISTAATSFTSASGPVEKVIGVVKPQIEIAAPDGIPYLLRLKTAFSYILSAYIPLHLHTLLNSLLLTPPTSSPSSSSSSSKIPLFTPLTTHLTHLATLRKEALAARNLNDIGSHKRRFEDEEGDTEGGGDRAEKKRRKEEEEKRKKAGESRGVRDLKKVNVSGMRKMSDFFKKK